MLNYIDAVKCSGNDRPVISFPNGAPRPISVDPGNYSIGLGVQDIGITNQRA
jgi:hypothetical protein